MCQRFRWPQDGGMDQERLLHSGVPGYFRDSAGRTVFDVEWLTIYHCYVIDRHVDTLLSNTAQSQRHCQEDEECQEAGVGISRRNCI